MTSMQNIFPWRRPKIFYGYWIVAALFFSAFIHSGCGFYVFSLFVRPLQAEFGWGRGDIMVAITIYMILQGAASPIVGKLYQRYGAKRLLAIGALVQGLGFALLPQMQSLWQYYLLYTVIGLGMAGSGMVPATAIISNWFVKRRGTALGIMATGIGAGGVVMAPLVGGYFLPNFGWEISYLVLAVTTWLFIPLALFVVKTKPSEKGLYPDGASEEEAAVETAVTSSFATGFSLRAALATATFWLIAVSFLTANFSYIGIIQNQVAHLEDIGFSSALAATILSAVGVGSLIGKFGFGRLCDRIPAKYVWGIAVGLQAIGIAIFVNVGPTSSTSVLWLYAIIIGLGIGGNLPTMSMLISTYFGLANYGVIFGMLHLVANIGTAAGPVFTGYMFDNTGTYQLAFTVLLVLYVVALPTILLVRSPKLPPYITGR